jgi:hypothetical protein
MTLDMCRNTALHGSVNFYRIPPNDARDLVDLVKAYSGRRSACNSGSMSASMRDSAPRSDGCNWPVAEYVAG